jgi:ech hydrogenase subunit A
MAALIFLLIVAPGIAALGCFLFRGRTIRSAMVLLCAGLQIMTAALLTPRVPFHYTPATLFAVNIHEVVRGADFSLLMILFYFGIKHRNLPIQVLSIFQIVMLGYLEFFLVAGGSGEPAFYCDHLSLIMVPIISIVGGIICVQAIPYMKNHERHLNIPVSRQPVFFFVMLLFLGAMNGVVLANDMKFFYFFFELTTLCSFLLIGHRQAGNARCPPGA